MLALKSWHFLSHFQSENVNNGYCRSEMEVFPPKASLDMLLAGQLDGVFRTLYLKVMTDGSVSCAGFTSSKKRYRFPAIVEGLTHTTDFWYRFNGQD